MLKEEVARYTIVVTVVPVAAVIVVVIVVVGAVVKNHQVRVVGLLKQ